MEELEIKLDFRAKKPLSDQVQEKIYQQIERGTLKPGDQLPPVRALAARLKVNFNTIARAYRALDENGWISTRQGRGTYVIEREFEPHSLPSVTKETVKEDLIAIILVKAREADIPIDDICQSLKRNLRTNSQEDKIAVRRRKRLSTKKSHQQIGHHKSDLTSAHLTSRTNPRKPHKRNIDKL